MLEQLDIFILDNIFQPIADFLYSKYEKNNFFWARIAMYAVGVSWFFTVAISYTLFGMIILVIYFTASYFKHMILSSREMKAEETTDKAYVNPDREFFYDGIFRILFVFLLCMEAGFLITSSFDLDIIFSALTSVFLVFTTYFEACTPKPKNFFHNWKKVEA